MKITAKTGRGLFPATSTYKITPDSIGYPLADNLCYLTGVDGYTKNEVQPEWATKVIKTIESKFFFVIFSICNTSLGYKIYMIIYILSLTLLIFTNKI